MKDWSQVSKTIDRLIIQARLNEINVMLNSDASDRLSRILKSIELLKSGAYLLGTGPATTGIIPLSVEEITFGRQEMPGEKTCDILIDVTIADTIHFCPQEVSRAHAKIVTRESTENPENWLVDLYSTCGTFVNGERIDPHDIGRKLQDQDIISFGSSHVNTYLYLARSTER